MTTSTTPADRARAAGWTRHDPGSSWPEWRDGAGRVVAWQSRVTGRWIAAAGIEGDEDHVLTALLDDRDAGRPIAYLDDATGGWVLP